MSKRSKELDIANILDMISRDSSNNWDDLCDKCSSLVKDSGITNEEIDEIVKKCKKV